MVYCVLLWFVCAWNQPAFLIVAGKLMLIESIGAHLPRCCAKLHEVNTLGNGQRRHNPPTGRFVRVTRLRRKSRIGLGFPGFTNQFFSSTNCVPVFVDDQAIDTVSILNIFSCVLFFSSFSDVHTIPIADQAPWWKHVK